MPRRRAEQGRHSELLNILHVNHASEWHGGERQTLLLAAALHARGVGTALACRAGSPLEARAREQGVPVIPLPRSVAAATLALARVGRQFDLVHCHTARAHSQAALAAPLHRKPVIATRRVDVWPKPNWFNRHKYHSAAKIVCISNAIARQLQDWGLPAHKLPVIPSTVPTPPAGIRAPENRRALRARLQIPPEAPLVGNIANLLRHKDQATLLRAAAELRPQIPDLRVIILGGGQLWDSLQALRRELGLESTVLMPGYVPQAQQYLPALDVFAMSSSTEGLGSIVLDAFAAGVPVASTAGGGLPELVRNGETGLLVPVGDHHALAQAILTLLRDAPLVTRLSQRAEQWVRENFSVEKMASSYLQIYRELLGPNA